VFAWPPYSCRLSRERITRIFPAGIAASSFACHPLKRCAWSSIVGDGLLHAAVAQSAWLEAHAWAMGAGILVLAGLYQFTPLKYACLDKCRSPLSFITEHWRGNHERTQAFRLGMRHGLFCIGCCWSLMLLMFAVGVGNLGWMLILGALMAIEKNLPWGRRISAPLGVVLLCWGLALGLEAVLA
jgi:predicted metal-binding membrane protein